MGPFGENNMEYLGEENVEVLPIVVLAQTFPARPSSIPAIRDFVRNCLAQSPLSDEDSRAVMRTVSDALLEAAGPTGTIQVSFRIFPEHAEVDVLRSSPDRMTSPEPGPVPALARAEPVAASNDVPGPVARPAAPGVATPADGQVPRQLPRQVDADEPAGADASFADWMAATLRREGMTMEAAARQLGVSVKTVSRWVGGATEPRLRDLRRIQEIFGELPFP